MQEGSAMTNVNPDELEVQNNEAARRFEVVLDAGVAQLRYDRDGSDIFLIHTEVPKELEGRGIAGRLASTALTFARENGLRAVVRCPYVKTYVQRHPEFNDVVFIEGGPS
jgi:predicted GNAT family acetyltransferase